MRRSEAYIVLGVHVCVRVMLFWRASAGHAFSIRGHWHQFISQTMAATWQSAIAEISLVVLLILTIILVVAAAAVAVAAERIQFSRTAILRKNRAETK
jgi:hypothetical protein